MRRTEKLFHARLVQERCVRVLLVREQLCLVLLGRGVRVQSDGLAEVLPGERGRAEEDVVSGLEGHDGGEVASR